MNNKIEKSRKDILWIDFMKAICLFLVFLFHSEFYCGVRFFEFTNYYARFFVNSFFFISGYLIFNKQLFSDLINLKAREWWFQRGGGRTMLTNGFWRIIVPTIIFCALIYFPKSILRGDDINFRDFFIDSFLGKSFWFTWALFWAELLIIISLLTRIKSIWFYVLFGIVMIYLEILIEHKGVIFFNNESMPWNYRKGMLACIFLAYGGVYKKFENRLDRFFLSTKGFFVLALMTLVYIIDIYNNKLMNADSSTLYYYYLSFLSIFILVYACKLCKGNNVTKYIGRSSIGFFFLSGALPNVFSLLVFKFNSGLIGPIMPLVVAIISFLFAFILVYALKKYLPFLFDLRLLWNNK